jgi:co-chaperonin GroES (HSP10)
MSNKWFRLEGRRLLVKFEEVSDKDYGKGFTLSTNKTKLPYRTATVVQVGSSLSDDYIIGDIIAVKPARAEYEIELDGEKLYLIFGKSESSDGDVIAVISRT